MSMEQFPKKEIETLWAPWRVEYFEKEPRDLEFLTAAARASDDAAHLVITRRKTAFLMMNRYPYSVGHLMAVPYRKTADLSSLGENEIVELWNLVTHAQALLRAATRAQGFNVGLNLGECAGAGVVALPKVVSFSLFFSFCSVWPLSAALISQRNICGPNIFPRITSVCPRIGRRLKKKKRCERDGRRSRKPPTRTKPHESS